MPFFDASKLPITLVVSELESGEEFILRKGMNYVVSDELSSHRSHTKDGVKVLIVDGDFLKKK